MKTLLYGPTPNPDHVSYFMTMSYICLSTVVIVVPNMASKRVENESVLKLFYFCTFHGRIWGGENCQIRSLFFGADETIVVLGPGMVVAAENTTVEDIKTLSDSYL